MRARFRPPRGQERRQLAPTVLCLAELGVGGAAGCVSLLHVVAPPAGVFTDATRAGLDLDDAGHDPVEERAVVRDHDQRCVDFLEKPLEPLETVEVEIVRRLVQQQDVVSRQEDRCERDACGLTTGQARRVSVEHELEAQLAEDRPRARVEVTAAQEEESRQRPLVAVVAGLVRRERRRSFAQLLLRCSNTGAALQKPSQRLAPARLRLLWQVADREGRRVVRDGPGVRLLEARHHPEQRGLADAVRSDEADPAERADAKGDLRDNDLGAEALCDARERDPHDGDNLLTGTARHEWPRERTWMSRSVRHGRAPGACTDASRS